MSVTIIKITSLFRSVYLSYMHLRKCKICVFWSSLSDSLCKHHLKDTVPLNGTKEYSMFWGRQTTLSENTTCVVALILNLIRESREMTRLKLFSLHRARSDLCQNDISHLGQLPSHVETPQNVNSFTFIERW